MGHNINNIIQETVSCVMYVDMNSFFASCEQQLNPGLRGRPIGICPFPGPRAVVIAASAEAKKFGVKTGMDYTESKKLCPDFEMVASRPAVYRDIHIQIMNILRQYFDPQDVFVKSIDEAVVNLTGYTHIYKDFTQTALNIKKDMAMQIGGCITCSIGIAANVFLAKLATEIQKPDGLVVLDENNLDGHLARMQLTDLPGIAAGNEKRLHRAGIYSPRQLRQASAQLLRKALGGIVGNYWYYRLHFKEVDLHTSAYKNMGVSRSLAAATRCSPPALQGMLVSLCTRLEQRMVKQDMFCRELQFSVMYYNGPPFSVSIRLQEPVQGAVAMLQYIRQKIMVYETESPVHRVLRRDIKMMGVMAGSFIASKYIQYGLFDNRLQQDRLRRAVYHIKDKYGKNIVRQASETISPPIKDAIGFGSVKDMLPKEHDRYQ